MVSGRLNVTTLSFVGILRSVRLLVVGTLMMISSRTILLLHPQTDQTVNEMCYDAVGKDARLPLFLFVLQVPGSLVQTRIINSLRLVFKRERNTHCFLLKLF